MEDGLYSTMTVEDLMVMRDTEEIVKADQQDDTFSAEQKQKYVECRSGVNGRPCHGGTR